MSSSLAEVVVAQNRVESWPEPVSPFMVWSAEDLLPVEDPALSEEDQGLFVDLLRDPDSMVARLLDPKRLQSALLGSLVVMVTSMSIFSLAVGSALKLDTAQMVRAASLVPFNALLAAMAAFGPAYATSVLVAARMPMARLITAITSALAAGAVILAALSPLPYVLLKLDPEWAGPLSLVAAFGLSAIVGGARVHRILTSMATAVRRASVDDPFAHLSEADAHRVGIFARVTMMILALTVSLSFWAFDALA